MQVLFRNDLYCVEWGVKLYSLTMQVLFSIVGAVTFHKVV